MSFERLQNSLESELRVKRGHRHLIRKSVLFDSSESKLLTGTLYTADNERIVWGSGVYGSTLKGYHNY